MGLLSGGSAPRNEACQGTLRSSALTSLGGRGQGKPATTRPPRPLRRAAGPTSSGLRSSRPPLHVSQHFRHHQGGNGKIVTAQTQDREAQQNRERDRDYRAQRESHTER